MERVGRYLFDPSWSLADAPGDQIAEVTGWFRGKLIGKELVARIFSEKTGYHRAAWHWEARGTDGEEALTTGWYRDEHNFIMIHETDLEDALTSRPDARAMNRIERQCQAWFASEMKANTKQPKSRDAYRRDARTRFRGISTRAIDRAWDDARRLTGAWGQAGRPKGK
jgi:hypothetical protein